ncbi:MAG: ferredoxin--NADP reductase [Bacteroidota bacterium]
MADHQFYNLKVKSITPETKDAVTVEFEVPQDLKDKFDYEPGQYLTLKFDLKGQKARRAYSMCSSPVEDHLAVTVKEVKNGLVSTHINRNLSVGQSVESMRPDGRFVAKTNPAASKTYYLFGAGSGITPLMSIIKSVLEDEPKSTVFLLYGNRNEETIIFEEKLKELERRYSGQLFVEHILSQPKKVKGKGWFAKSKVTWTGKVGRIKARLVKDFLKEHPKRDEIAEYYICGPSNMIESINRTLENIPEVNNEYIHVEYFSSASSRASKSVNEALGAAATVHLNGETVEVEVPAGKTILDALVSEGYDPPYSCTSGACSTCLAKTLRGELKMDVYYAIDEEEVEEGYILTCQAHPTTQEVEVTFEV